MHYLLIVIHSVVRWLLLAGLLYAIFRAFRGYYYKRNFTSLDNSVRHWTATIAHTQLIVGILIYTKSSIVMSFYKGQAGSGITQPLFFGVIHIIVMLLSVTLITIGSITTKRKKTDAEKFKQMLLWFSIALGLIFIAIPWPFSPLAQRPLFRSF